MALRTLFLLSLLSVSFLLVSPQAYASQPFGFPPARIAHRVALAYREAHPSIVHLEQTTTDSVPHQAMYVMGLSGHFHKGRKLARYLYFSALTSRWHVWGVTGLDNRHRVLWTDSILPRVTPHD